VGIERLSLAEQALLWSRARALNLHAK